MPIYEFYCPDNHRIYQFYAKTLAQGAIAPPCPDNPKFRMQKLVSSFAVVGKGGGKDRDAGDGAAAPPEMPGGARMEAAMGEMEREFSSVDESDPKAMGRMMRRMAELSGEKIGDEMEEVVRKLEEGADPDSLDEQLGGDTRDGDEAPASSGAGEARQRFRARRGAPARDPILYDYP
jgi:hypothetical protein